MIKKFCHTLSKIKVSQPAKCQGAQGGVGSKLQHPRAAAAARTAPCFPNNSLGNEFNMCGKEGAYICVVVRHVA